MHTYKNSSSKQYRDSILKICFQHSGHATPNSTLSSPCESSHQRAPECWASCGSCLHQPSVSAPPHESPSLYPTRPPLGACRRSADAQSVGSKHGVIDASKSNALGMQEADNPKFFLKTSSVTIINKSFFSLMCNYYPKLFQVMVWYLFIYNVTSFNQPVWPRWWIQRQEESRVHDSSGMPCFVGIAPGGHMNTNKASPLTQIYQT